MTWYARIYILTGILAYGGLSRFTIVRANHIAYLAVHPCTWVSIVKIRHAASSTSFSLTLGLAQIICRRLPLEQGASFEY